MRRLVKRIDFGNGAKTYLDVGKLAEGVVPLHESGEIGLGGSFGEEVVQSDYIPIFAMKSQLDSLEQGC